MRLAEELVRVGAERHDAQACRARSPTRARLSARLALAAVSGDGVRKTVVKSAVVDGLGTGYQRVVAR